MPKVNLSGMTVEALMDLRKRVDEALHKHRAKLQQQLERMGAFAVVTGRRVVRRGGSALKGRKVPPNFGVHQVILGQAVAQDLVGLSLRSKVERNSTIS